MKDKIKNFFMKKSKSSGSYYGDEGENSSIVTEKHFKVLEKENANLKKEFVSQVVSGFMSRRSIRKFLDKKPDFKIIHDVVSCGLSAPCAGNVQNVKVIIVENEDIRRECAKASYQQYWISDAPYLLVVCRDDTELNITYPDKGEFYSIQNCAAVIENILMATSFAELGACWVGAGDNDVLRSILSIPEEYKVDAIIPIGYANESPSIDKLEFDNCVFYEKFGTRNNVDKL